MTSLTSLTSLTSAPARWVRINRAFARVALHTLVQYKSDLVASLLASILSAATALIGILIIASNTESLNGWSSAGLILILGVHYIIGGAVGCSLAPSLADTVGLIRSGSFDYIVVQPIDTQFHSGARVFRVDAVAGVITGVVLIVAVVPRLEITPVGAAMFLVTLGAAVLCVAGWQYAVAGLAFTLIRVDALFIAFDQLYEQAGRWPVNVFPSYLRGVLTLVFPILLCVSVPAGSLSARGTMVPGGAVITLLCTAAGFMALSRLIWKRGLKRYVGGN